MLKKETMNTALHFRAKKENISHIGTIVFQNERALHILESEDQRKRNLTRGIDLSSESH